MNFDIQTLLHGDLKALIETIGYIGVFSIVFAESGLLFGFIFPGDSLLFTAGFLASQGFFNIVYLSLGCFIAAVTGDSAGYWIGHKFGRKLYQKEDSTFFKKDHLKKAEGFYEKHGGKTIVVARFIPIIRTFAPVAAGMSNMKYSHFLFFNIFGGAFWAIGISLAGYFLGSIIPDVDKYLLPIIALIIIVSFMPPVFDLLKHKSNRDKLLHILHLK